MTQNSNKTETEQEKSTKRWSRKEKAEKQAKLEKAAEQGISQRAATKQNGVPRSTARAWEKKETEISSTPGVNPEVVKFLASPAGTEFVHRLVISVVFVFTLNNPAGLDKVCEFLSLSNLDKVVGSSHGSIQKLSVEIHKLLAEFSQEQIIEKKATMEQKEITLCLDETFFRRLLCLVAIEPVSNFILLEKDVEDRKADTWLKNIEEAIGELPINVIQITSDEAKALLCLAKDLEIPHSPDLFHVLQPLIRAMSLRMAKLVKTAMEAYQKAVEKTQKLIVNQDEAANKKRGSGRTSIFQRCLAEAESEEDKAKKALETAQANQRKMSAAIAGISEDYHPYSLKTGQKQSAEQVETLLYKRFSTIENIAEKVQLPEACFKAIKKSKKLVPSMVESIRFFHMKIVESISTLSLNMGQIYHVLTCLIPALYLSRVANRATLADDRKDLMEMAQNILKSRGDDHPLQQIEEKQLRNIINISQYCADIFQRSSSCVEGRNGRLSLFHHGFHHLSKLKLTALTVVHNYHIRRPDGTTAAERLFGLPHDNLFEWLIGRVGDLPRPAKKRKKTQTNFVDNFYFEIKTEQEFSGMI